MEPHEINFRRTNDIQELYEFAKLTLFNLAREPQFLMVDLIRKGKSPIISVQTSPFDLGLFIGKEGNMAQALRVLFTHYALKKLGIRDFGFHISADPSPLYLASQAAQAAQMPAQTKG